MPTPEVQAFLDHNARARRLNLEATAREQARLADIGPVAYAAELAAESDRQAYHEEEAAHHLATN